MSIENAFTIGADDSGRRLDRVVRKCFSGMPLSAIHKAFRKGAVRIDGEARKPDYRCREGERLQIGYASLQELEEERERLPAEHEAGAAGRIISGLIVLETEDLLFLNKPAGLLVHDGTESLEWGVRHYLAPLLPPSLSFQPGPLHRLDRNTSGIIAFSRSLPGARAFSQALAEGKIHRSYLAVIEGSITGPERWEDRLGRNSATRTSRKGDEGDPCAITLIEPVASASDGAMSLVRLSLLTGRTHQIRAQASLHGHPLAGDGKYGSRAGVNPYLLHAECISFEEELLPELPSAVRAPLPSVFAEFIAKVFYLDEGDIPRLHPAVFPRRDMHG
jgi:23S rRNA pseudouridine955/2504/2580 synthase